MNQNGQRKLVVSEFLSLDGVMQAPGQPDEDTEGGFKHGGWIQALIFPVILGSGKRLFGDPIDRNNLRLAESRTTPKGVLMLDYRPGGG